MMKRYIKKLQMALATILAVASMVSCADDLINPYPSYNFSKGEVSYNDDGTLNVILGLEIPEWNKVGTRAMGDNPDYAALGIYMLVFQGEDGLTQYARLSHKEDLLKPDEMHGHNNLVNFHARLWPTANPVVIHIIATDQPNFSQQIGSGMDEATVGRLFTDEGHEAYWQRIDIGTNIPSREQSEPEFDKRPDAEHGNVYSEEEHEKALRIVEKLNHIPMVRNFAKVTVELSSLFPSHNNHPDDYKITGLYVINTVDRGTVAPYRASFHDPDGFAEFFDTIPGENGKEEYKPFTYRIMTDDPTKDRPNTKEPIDPKSQNYIGNLASGIAIINNDVSDENKIETKSVKENPDPVYFYENTARENSEDRTYTIVKIQKKVTDPNTNAVKYEDHYYKIDLGHVWDPYVAYPYMGIFEYYNLLRNFHFDIKINRIDGDGYPTLKEAANGPVFNNISASVEAKNMKAISDGDDWIYVSRTSYVFTNTGDTLNLQAQYRENINQGGKGGTINNQVIFKNTPVLSDELKGYDRFVELYSSECKSWTSGYANYVLKCNGTPGPEFRTQEFYIYRGPIDNPVNGEYDKEQGNIEYGLYRIVTLYMHERFQFRRMDTFPGLWEDPSELPDFTWTNKKKREVDATVGAPLTLFFELPPDLPQALFPLEFVIESDHQNIQNAYAGNAVVRSVSAKESLFYEEGGTNNPTTSRIQYVKTVTWKDYNGEWGDTWTPDGSKMVRCRFLTITDLKQDGIGNGSTGNATSETKLRVYNEYFGTKPGTPGNPNPDADWLTYQEDGFTRDEASSDPTPRIWDFNSSNWENIFLTMNGSRSKYADNNNNNTVIDDGYSGSDDYNVKRLHLIEGGTGANARTMSMGTVQLPKPDGEEGETVNYRYIKTSSQNDYFYFTYDYPKPSKREIRIDVMMTDEEGNTEGIDPPRIIEGKDPLRTNGTGFTLTGSQNVMVDGTPYKKFMFEGEVPAGITSINVNILPPSSKPTMRFFRIEFYPRWDDMKTQSTTP